MYSPTISHPPCLSILLKKKKSSGLNHIKKQEILSQYGNTWANPVSLEGYFLFNSWRSQYQLYLCRLSQPLGHVLQDTEPHPHNPGPTMPLTLKPAQWFSHLLKGLSFFSPFHRKLSSVVTVATDQRSFKKPVCM